MRDTFVLPQIHLGDFAKNQSHTFRSINKALSRILLFSLISLKTSCNIGLHEEGLHACQVASVVSDSATLWTVAHQTPLSIGFSRREYWSGLPCPPPGNRPYPGIKPVAPALQADSLPLSHRGSPNEEGLFSCIFQMRKRAQVVTHTPATFTWRVWRVCRPLKIDNAFQICLPSKNSRGL